MDFTWPDELNLPELTMLLVNDLAAVDHHECTVVLIANALVQPGMSAAELDAAYHRVMESGWVLLGKELETFEAEYAASVGVQRPASHWFTA